jgi:hypothetical protein
MYRYLHVFFAWDGGQSWPNHLISTRFRFTIVTLHAETKLPSAWFQPDLANPDGGTVYALLNVLASSAMSAPGQQPLAKQQTPFSSTLPRNCYTFTQFCKTSALSHYSGEADLFGPKNSG